MAERRSWFGNAAGRRKADYLIADGTIIVLVVFWLLAALGTGGNRLPPPWSIARSVMQLAVDHAFAVHTAYSALRILTAIVAAMALGAALALIPMRWPSWDGVVHDRIKPFMNSFPSLGWALLGTIWFNVSEFAIVFIETAILIPFCLINLSEGLRSLDPELGEMATSCTRSWRRHALVDFPQLMPFIVATLRIAYGVGWKVALVAELFGAKVGLGYFMKRAEVLADMSSMLATCFIIVFLYQLGDLLVIGPLARRYPA